MFKFLKWIKVYKGVRKMAKEVKKVQKKKDLKAGIKTTEFWLVVVSNLLTIAGTLKGIIPAKYSAIIIAVLTGIYTILRSYLKMINETKQIVKNE